VGTWPGVAIVLVNWNNGFDTIECLESLQNISYPKYYVIVVDNNSSDSSIPLIRAWADGRPRKDSYCIKFNLNNKPIQVIWYSRSEAEAGGTLEKEEKIISMPSNRRLIIIVNESNLGFSGGNNVGIKYALLKNDVSFIWLLNNDTIVGKDALMEMVKKLKEYPKAAFCGSVILDYYNPDKIQTVAGGSLNIFLGIPRPIMRKDIYNLKKIQKKKIKINYITGCSLLINKSYLNDIGLMDESFFLYWEDAEWSERCGRKGFFLTYSPRSKVWHKKGNTSKILKRAAYFDSYNCLRFFRRYYACNLPLILITRPFVGISIYLKNSDIVYLREFLKGYLCFLKNFIIQR